MSDNETKIQIGPGFFGLLTIVPARRAMIKHCVDAAKDFHLVYDERWNPIHAVIRDNGIEQRVGYSDDSSVFLQVEAEVASYVGCHTCH
jgi:hypothetical protein